MDIVTNVDSGDTRQRTVSQQRQCAITVDSGDTWQSRALTRELESKEREKARENTQGEKKRQSRQRMVGEPKGKGEGKQKHERMG